MGTHPEAAGESPSSSAVNREAFHSTQSERIGDTGKFRAGLILLEKAWRRQRESNAAIGALQAPALPLGYVAEGSSWAAVASQSTHHDRRASAGGFPGSNTFVNR